MRNNTTYSWGAAVATTLAFALPAFASAAQVNIALTDDAYTPKNTSINLGDTVTWVNTGVHPHTVTADGGIFSSVTLQQGQSFSYTFSGTGTFPYHCTFHGGAAGVGMAGTISVSPGASTTGGGAVGGSTASPSALSSQAAILLAQVQLLQQQLASQGGGYPAVTSTNGAIINSATGGTVPVSGTAGVNSSACPNIGRVLRNGSTGDDVSRLQQFLARDPSVYPEANVSGYYGGLTQAAVQRWQAKYNVVSSGSPETTGYGMVGPRTAATIALLCSTGGAAGNASAPVGGYIQVSPISGNAPLAVNVVATVNTTGSCAGAIYTLSWGDNTNPIQIPVSANNCGQVAQTYQHTYSFGGTYLVTLSAGAHKTTATVSVYGAAVTTGTAAQTQNSALPAETFSASPTSGGAPLGVSFTGILTSADSAWCASGCSNVLNFGDGSSVSIPLPTAQNTWQNYAVAHTYQSGGTFNAILYHGSQNSNKGAVGNVTITVSGTGSGTGSTGSNTYQPMTVTPNVNGNPLSVTVGFDLPSSCTGYDLAWGDSSAHITQSDGGSSCGQTTTTKIFSHTFSSASAYTVTLKRGPSLSRTDSASISITN